MNGVQLLGVKGFAMYIKCWGSRGSVPVSGKEYIKYGGDTTCLEIRTGTGDIIVVDSGTGIRRLGNQLLSEGRFTYHFLFTHAHWDHLMGLPFFKPLYLEQARFNIYKCPFSDQYVQKMIERIMAPPHFPVKYSSLKADLIYEEACPTPFSIGSTAISPISLSHPNGASGYKFTENGRSFAFLTDNELSFRHPGGLPFDRYVEFCAGADLLIHDAEYTPKEYRKTVEWGHSTYTDVVELAIRAGVKRLGLFHINQERSDRAMDAIVEKCRRTIAEKGLTLECCAVAQDMEFTM